jgi:hypothetical protein
MLQSVDNTACGQQIDAEENMPACDLEQLFGSVVDHLPEATEESFIISAAALPQLRPRLTTDQLVIRAGRHGHHSYTHVCVDELHIQAQKRTYRLLGLAFLAKVFHPEPHEVQIQLTNPHSPVRTLVLDYDQAQGWNLVTGYDKRPYQYSYEPQPVTLSTARLDERFFPAWLLPLFTLTDVMQVAGPCDDRDVRDTVHGAGSDYGNVLFATLLLNLGRLTETIVEFGLESEYGYGGVGRGSAEIRLWLPGGNGWLDVL